MIWSNLIYLVSVGTTVSCNKLHYWGHALLTTNLVNKRYEEKRKECVYFMREILLKSLWLSKKCHLPIYLKFGVSINDVDIIHIIYFLHFSRGVELYEASPPREFISGYCQLHSGCLDSKKFFPLLTRPQGSQGCQKIRFFLTNNTVEFLC